MSAKTNFVVKKKIGLDHLGEGWEGASITMTPFSFRDNEAIISLRTVVTNQNISAEEAKKASDEVVALLQEKLIEGVGFNGEKLVPITKDNLADLPMEIVVMILQTLQGQTQLSPKV
jgi:hypothetical protein